MKYKTKNISSGDLYQLGFYMHEFSEMNRIDGKNTDRILDEFHYRVGSGKEDCPTGESLYAYFKKRFFNQ